MPLRGVGRRGCRTSRAGSVAESAAAGPTTPLPGSVRTGGRSGLGAEEGRMGGVEEVGTGARERGGAVSASWFAEVTARVSGELRA